MVAQARPDYLPVDPSGIPQALKDRVQWVAWRAERRPDGWTKVPINVATGEKASATDPATWAAFARALRFAEDGGYQGIGYVFSADDPYVGIDLDKCHNPQDGGLTTLAASLVAELDSLTEITPSGTGLHIIAEASVPKGKGRRSIALGVEVYDRGRFFTMTGRQLGDFPTTPQPRQEEVDRIHARLFPVAVVEPNEPVRPTGLPPADDQIILDRIRRSPIGGRFERLWHGDKSGHNDDDSSADLALCNYLAHFVGPDNWRIDRIFRHSNLMRTKWDSPRPGGTYGSKTIEKALDGRTVFCEWNDGQHDDSGVTFLLDMGQDTAEVPPPSTEAGDYRQTDTGNANLFTALYQGELRYDHRRDLWYRWGGHWWAPDDNSHAFRLTGTIADKWFAAANDTPEGKERKALFRWANQTESRAKREAMLRIAGTNEPIALNGANWDTDPFLFGVANGVVDLTTGKLQSGYPLDEITMHSDVPYNPRAKAPRWEQFLTEVFRDDRDLIDWVQRFVGYSLTGDISEHALVLCFGSGSNGKSTFLNTLAYVMGDYAYTTPFSVLERNDRESAATNDLAALAGRRLVSASETNEGRQFNEARIKALTGGDPLTARFLHKEFFTFRPVLKLWLAVNHKPVVRDDSRGFWRRFRMLPFLASFDGKTADKHLDRTLQAEAPGIFAWAVRGCLDWQQRGLSTPQAVSDATAEYERESDPLAPFIAQVCNIGEQQVIRANEFYMAYVDWTGEQGLQGKEVLTRTMFGRRMGERFAKTEDRLGTLYHGVGLAFEWTERKKNVVRFTP